MASEPGDERRAGSTHAPHGAAAEVPRAIVDFAGIDAWLGCARSATELTRCEAASAATQGGQYAAAAMATFGDDKPNVATPSVASVAQLV